MFRNLVLTLSIIFILSLGVSAQQRTWRTFTPPSEAWSVLSPGNMIADDEAAKPDSKRGSYSYSDSNSFFAVIYSDYSKLNNLLPWKKNHFNKQRDAVMKANKATLIRDSEFTSGNITGREIRLRMPDNRTFARESNLKPQHRIQRFRMFFQGNRFYMILAVLPEEQISLPEIDKYFESFRLK
jgi:hypothetical protein